MVWWEILLIVLAICFIVWLVYKLISSEPDELVTKPRTRRRFFEADRSAEDLVSDEINQFLVHYELDNLCHFYNDLYIPNQVDGFEKVSQIDHLLITPKTIYIIETKGFNLNANNQLRGNLDEETLNLYSNWTEVSKPISNPFGQNESHIRTLKRLFYNNNIHYFNFENIVLIKNNSYNKTTSTSGRKIYAINDFIQLLVEQEVEVPTNNQKIRKTTIKAMTRVLDEVVFHKPVYQQFHQEVNNY